MSLKITFAADAPRIGGAEAYLAAVIAAACDGGHAATLVAPQDDLLERVRAEAPSARLVLAGSAAFEEAPNPAARFAGVLQAVAPMAAAVARSRPDVLHLNNGGYPGSDLVRLLAILTPTPRRRARVMSVHSVPLDREYASPRIQRAVDVPLWHRLAVVTGATEVVGRGLVQRRGMPASMYRRIPYGVEAPGGEAQAGELRARFAPDGELLAGMLSGTADPGKGHDVFLDAVAASGPGVRGLVIGADPGPAFGERARRLGVEDRVIVAGRVPEVGPYIHALDVVVVPSTAFESLPLVVLEAMGARKPVFASRLSGIPEAVESGVTGELFEPGDAPRLAALLAAAAEDRDRLSDQGRAGGRAWAERFSREAMVAATLSLYDELAGRR